MIPVPTGVRVWLATGRTDMRKGFDGLALLVQETLRVNRRATLALARSRCRLRELSSGTEKARSEEIELCATVHLAFDKLELRDLSFGLPVRPGFGKCGGHRALVGSQPVCEGGKQARGRVLKPGVQVFALTLADHDLEAVDQVSCGDECWNGSLDRGDRHSVAL